MFVRSIQRQSLVRSSSLKVNNARKPVAKESYKGKVFFTTVEQAKVEGESNLKYKEFKDISRKEKPFLWKLWTALGLAGVIGSAAYYWNEEDRHERDVDQTIKMIESYDPEVKLKGINSLDNCLFLKKKLWTLTTELPKSKAILVERGCVEALLNAFREGDENIKERAMIWLIRLTDEPEGRKRLLLGGLEPILEVLLKPNTNPSLWIAAGDLLCHLSKYADTSSHMGTSQMKHVIANMYTTSVSPIAQLLAAKIESNLQHNNISLEVAADKTLASLSSPTCAAALNAAVSVVIPPEPKAINPPDALLRGDLSSYFTLMNAAAFGVFGSIWGAIRWGAAAKIHGLSGKDYTKFVSKHSRVGRHVFFLLMLDPIAQLLMGWPKDGVKIPFVEDRIQNPLPPSIRLETAVPIAESFIFVGSLLYALRYRRYVLLPMTLAVGKAHWETISDKVKEYSDLLGYPVDLNDQVNSLLSGKKEK